MLGEYMGKNNNCKPKKLGHGNICEYCKPCRDNGTCSPLPPIMFEHLNVNVLPRVSMVTGVKINVQKICQLRSLKCWPVYKYEIFLDYTSNLQKKATHLCLDMLLYQGSHRLDIYIA
nr:hypothetical protein BgiMline_006863 [Biomphalaria glabrata]